MKVMRANISLAQKINELISLDSQSKKAKKLIDETEVCFEVALNETDCHKEKVILGAIYELVDLYYDSYFEGFPNVVDRYSFEEARCELTSVVNALMSGNLEQLIDSDFVARVAKLIR